MKLLELVDHIVPWNSMCVVPCGSSCVGRPVSTLPCGSSRVETHAGTHVGTRVGTLVGPY